MAASSLSGRQGRGLACLGRKRRREGAWHPKAALARGWHVLVRASFLTPQCRLPGRRAQEYSCAPSTALRLYSADEAAKGEATHSSVKY